MNLETTAIKSVTFYQAAPVESCDRCGTGIKNVFSVAYRDGETQKYGSECINKILDNQPTLRSLFNKNAKLLKRYQEYLAILSGPVESMPRGQEYWHSGLYMIADSKGKNICFDHYFFHPVIDAAKNSAGKNYVVTSEADHAFEAMRVIDTEKPKLAAEIARLEAFLGKVLRNVKPVKEATA